MKIDFNGNGMTINFDKVPKFLYVNEESHGCGGVLVNGVRIKPLMIVDIHAQTNDDKGCYPLKYSIKYGEYTETGEPKTKIIYENKLHHSEEK